MRRSFSRAERILTFFSLVCLLVLSFTLVLLPDTIQSPSRSVLHKRSLYRPRAPISGTSSASVSFTPNSDQPSPTAGTATPSTTPSPITTPSPSPQPSFSPSSSPSPTSTPITHVTSVTSSSSSQSQTPSATFSQSSSSSSSSTSSSKSSTTTQGGNAPTPRTTFFANSIYTNSEPTVTSAVSNETAGAAVSSAKGFFANKGAVAGTFTVVALIIVGLVMATVMFCMRRRRNLRLQDDEYFDKYTEPIVPRDTAADNLGHLGGMGPSSTDVTTPAAMNAYPSRDIHYGPSDSHVGSGDMQEYGLEYPPGTAYAAATSQDGPYHYTGHQEHGDSHAYAGENAAIQPEYSQYPSEPVPPSAFQVIAQEHAYEPSIDSFYGSAATARSSQVIQ